MKQGCSATSRSVPKRTGVTRSTGSNGGVRTHRRPARTRGGSDIRRRRRDLPARFLPPHADASRRYLRTGLPLHRADRHRPRHRADTLSARVHHGPRARLPRDGLGQRPARRRLLPADGSAHDWHATVEHDAWVRDCRDADGAVTSLMAAHHERAGRAVLIQDAQGLTMGSASTRATMLRLLLGVAEPIARRAASASMAPRTQRHHRRSPPTSSPLRIACYSRIAMASTSTRKSGCARRRTSTVVLVGRAPKYSIRTSTW